MKYNCCTVIKIASCNSWLYTVEEVWMQDICTPMDMLILERTFSTNMKEWYMENISSVCQQIKRIPRWDWQQRGRTKEPKTDQSKTSEITWKKSHGAAHKSTIYQRDYRGEEENFTFALYNRTYNSIIYWCFIIIHPNDGVFLFIGKTKVTSCEISKLSLKCFLNFVGKKTSELDRFQAGLGFFI